MNTEQPDGLDPDFAQRMRSGLSLMAVRERRRERERRKLIGAGVATAAVAGVIALTVSQFGIFQPASDQAVPPATPSTSAPAPPTPSVTEPPTPSVEPTATPTPTPSAPRPPAGFEGVAAGVPIVVASGPFGPSGDAADDRPSTSISLFVLCMGQGTVTAPHAEDVICAQESQGTIVQQSAADYPDTVDIVASSDFNGVVSWAPLGQQPAANSQGGTATVTVQCFAQSEGFDSLVYSIGDTIVDCANFDIAPGQYVDVSMWGIPYSAGQFGPAVTSNMPSGTIRTHLEGPF